MAVPVPFLGDKKMACEECGCRKFRARFKYRGDAIVDEHGDWEKDVKVDDAEFYGPYTCEGCGKEYDPLPKV